MGVNPRPFLEWENDWAMDREVPLGDETLPGEARLHSNSRPLPVVGWPPKDPWPWE